MDILDLFDIHDEKSWRKYCQIEHPDKYPDPEVKKIKEHQFAIVSQLYKDALEKNFIFACDKCKIPVHYDYNIICVDCYKKIDHNKWFWQ